MGSEEEYKGFLASNPVPGVENLSEVQQAMVRELFQGWAQTNDMYVSKEEYIAKMRGSALGETQGLAFLEIMDMGGATNINLPEFLRFFDEFHGGAMADDEFTEFVKGFQPDEE